MSDKIKIDPANDKTIVEQSHMSTEEIKRHESSVESEYDIYNESEGLDNFIKKK